MTHACTVLIAEQDGKRLPLGIRASVPKVINNEGEWDYLEENGKEISHRIFTPKSLPNQWALAKLHA